MYGETKVDQLIQSRKSPRAENSINYTNVNRSRSIGRYEPRVNDFLADNPITPKPLKTFTYTKNQEGSPVRNQIPRNSTIYLNSPKSINDKDLARSLQRKGFHVVNVGTKYNPISNKGKYRL